MSSSLPKSSFDQLKNFSAVIPFSLSGCDHLNLAITTTDAGLAGIGYMYDQAPMDPANRVAEKVVQQLEHYFDDPQWTFDLPLDLRGTDFQRRLWWSLCTVSAGQTDTYGQLAHQLNSGAQAVGQACRRNPVPIVVPCHRIVSKQGMGGYVGETDGDKMRIKEALLAHEDCLVG